MRTKNYYNHEVNFFWFEKKSGGCEVVIVLTKKYKFETNPVRKYKTSADYKKSKALYDVVPVKQDQQHQWSN